MIQPPRRTCLYSRGQLVPSEFQQVPLETERHQVEVGCIPTLCALGRVALDFQPLIESLVRLAEPRLGWGSRQMFLWTKSKTCTELTVFASSFAMRTRRLRDTASVLRRSCRRLCMTSMPSGARKMRSKEVVPCGGVRMA
jgi:hypothetical protein